MPPLVVIVDDMSGPARRMEFERSPVRIGRAPDNELPLDMAFVSSRHAEIRFEGQEASYADLGSTNGTFLEGQRIPAHRPVPVNGTLRVHIGSVRLTIEHGQITRENLGDPSRAPATAAMASLASLVPTPASEAPDTLAEPSPVSAAAPDFPLGSPSAEPSPAPASVSERRDHSGHGDRPVEAHFSPPSIVAPRPPRHQTPGPPTILPPSYEGERDSGPARGRNQLSPPTIFPTSPKDFPSPFSSADPRPVAGEIHVETPPRARDAPVAPITPERTAPASQGSAVVSGAISSPSRRTDSPAAGVVTGARAEEPADLGDLRELATSLCDDLMKLRAAMEAFGRETGIRTFSHSERARLHELRDGAELFRALTAPTTRAIRRTEVRALFSDLVAHQLALMGAIVEGARATLTRVDPENFEKDNPRRRLPFLDSGRWDEYLQRFHEFQQDDQAIQEAVFGAEFADAYAAARGK
ncbi:MAG TPA: FHA domain-containing protein [Polyangia bacterium]